MQSRERILAAIGRLLNKATDSQLNSIYQFILHLTK